MKGVANVTDYCRYVFTLILLCIIKSVGIINCTKKYVQVDLWYYNISTEHDIIIFIINSVMDITNKNNV